MRVVPLVKVQLVTHAVDNNVPGVDRTRGGHQQGNNGVSSKDIALIGLCQLLDNGVVAGGDPGVNGGDTLEGTLVLRGDSVKGLIIEVEGAQDFAG